MMSIEEYHRLLAKKKEPKKARMPKPVDITAEQTDTVTTITVMGVMPCLPNRQFHYSVKTKLRTQYEWMLRACKLTPIKQKVRLCIIGYYASKPKDDDGFTASYKHLRDAMVNTGLLIDDSPTYIEQPPHYEQIKCKHRSEVRTIITITII
jgi:hypothetical protein